MIHIFNGLDGFIRVDEASGIHKEREREREARARVEGGGGSYRCESSEKERGVISFAALARKQASRLPPIAYSLTHLLIVLLAITPGRSMPNGVQRPKRESHPQEQPSFRICAKREGVHQ